MNTKFSLALHIVFCLCIVGSFAFPVLFHQDTQGIIFALYAILIKLIEISIFLAKVVYRKERDQEEQE